MYELVQLEFMEYESDDITSVNGSYQWKQVFEGGAFADEMTADERRWREKIRKGINEILWLRVAYNESKRYGHKYKARQLEEDIKRRKKELKEIILSRDYEWRG